jgi:hypothetical protein
VSHLPPDAAQDYDQTQYKNIATFFLMWGQQRGKKKEFTVKKKNVTVPGFDDYVVNVW